MMAGPAPRLKKKLNRAEQAHRSGLPAGMNAFGDFRMCVKNCDAVHGPEMVTSTMVAARGWTSYEGDMGYRKNRKRFDDWLSRLEPTKFETMLAEFFRDQGYRVEHVGAAVQGRRFDGGVDLKLFKDDDYSIVQCKNWNARQVTHNAVHELLGVMLTQRATAAVVVSSGEFTAHAITSAAEDRRIRLIDGVELRRLLATWPGRTRWTSTHQRSPFREFVQRCRVAGFAFAALALLMVSLVALAIFGKQGSNIAGTITTAAIAGEPAPASRARVASTTVSMEPVSGGYAASSRRLPTRASVQQAIGEKVGGLATSAMILVDPNRRIDPESARLAVRRIAGVRSAVWMDQTNFIVRVDRVERRSMAMIDEVCDALEPLGDTLGVVVAVQNANARNGDEMETLTRNCQLAEGQRAFGQRKRQIDTVSPEVRAQFKAMQERNQSKR